MKYVNQRKWIIFLVLPLLILFGYFFLDYAKNPLTPGFGIYPTLNETEKALVSIINQSLERALIQGEIIDGAYPNQSQPVVLSTRYIDAYWVLPVEGWDVQVLPIDEIMNEYEGVDVNGRRLRLWVQFNEIEFVSDESVYVEMGLQYDVFQSEWGIAYWGLRLYFEKNESGWVIKNSKVLVI
jgi:hypothetical protein